MISLLLRKTDSVNAMHEYLMPSKLPSTMESEVPMQDLTPEKKCLCLIML